MTSSYSRISGVWSDYFGENVEESEPDIEPEMDRRTRLDKTIDGIGMGESLDIALEIMYILMMSKVPTSGHY